MPYTQRDGDLVLVVPPRRITDSNVAALLRELDRYLAGTEPYVLLFDLSDAGLPSAAQRRELARHLKDGDATIRRMVRAIAIVAASPALRGVVTATFWLAPPPVEHRLFSTRPAAQDWLATRLSERQIG